MMYRRDEVYLVLWTYGCVVARYHEMASPGARDVMCYVMLCELYYC